MKNISEDIAYGIYDRPGPGADELEPLENPVVAGPQMSVQLAVEKPPIDDEDYIPTSISALSNSAAEMARHVPPDQIKYFYRGLHKLLDDSTDRTTTAALEDDDMSESIIKRNIKVALLEIIGSSDEKEFEEYRAGEEYGTRGVDYFGDEDEDELTPSDQGDESNLDSLADEFGFSGPSGVRQYINRVLKRLGFFAEVADGNAINSLIQFAVPEYVQTMKEGGYIDAEDVTDLQSAPDLVKDLPSFKYFFVSGFILPSYREYGRETNNSARAQIDAANLPKSVRDTVFNQATGLATRDLKALRLKIQAAVKKGELGQSDISAANTAAAKIVTADADKPPATQDFVDKALEKWQSLNRSRRQTVLKKALSETLDET